MNHHRTAAGFLAAMTPVVLAGCSSTQIFWRHTAEYPDGITFSGDYFGPEITRAEWRRLDHSRYPRSETKSFECKWNISTPDGSFQAEDFEYEAFQVAGAEVPVRKYTSKEDNHRTIRQEPLEGTLVFEGDGYRISCRYEDDRRLRHISVHVVSPRPEGFEGLSVSIGGRSVKLPCSVRRLKKQLGEPLSLKKV
jgi:hypothetical protein